MLVSDAAVAYVLLTVRSQAGQDPQPTRGRATFSFATWLSPEQALPPWGNPPLAEAFSWLPDQRAYLGSCSLAAAAARYPFAEDLTKVPPVLAEGATTGGLSSDTVGAAGCACARAQLNGTRLVTLASCGPSGFYAAAAPPAAAPPWLVSQTVLPSSGPCSLQTEALFSFSPAAAASLPFVFTTRTQSGALTYSFSLSTVEVTSSSSSSAGGLQYRVTQHAFLLLVDTAGAAGITMAAGQLQAPMKILPLSAAAVSATRVSAVSAVGQWRVTAYVPSPQPSAYLSAVTVGINVSTAICSVSPIPLGDYSSGAVAAATGASVTGVATWLAYALDISCTLVVPDLASTLPLTVPSALFTLTYSLANAAGELLTDARDPPSAQFYSSFSADALGTGGGGGGRSDGIGGGPGAPPAPAAPSTPTSFLPPPPPQPPPETSSSSAYSAHIGRPPPPPPKSPITYVWVVALLCGVLTAILAVSLTISSKIHRKHHKKPPL